MYIATTLKKNFYSRSWEIKLTKKLVFRRYSCGFSNMDTPPGKVKLTGGNALAMLKNNRHNCYSDFLFKTDRKRGREGERQT